MKNTEIENRLAECAIRCSEKTGMTVDDVFVKAANKLAEIGDNDSKSALEQVINFVNSL